MRILHIISTINPRAGGTTEAVKQLSAAIVSLGHANEVLTLDDPRAPWLAETGCPVNAAGPARGSYRYVRGLPAIIAERARGFDVLVIHGLWQHHSSASRAAAAKLGIPYYVYPHGMLDPWFNKAYPLKALKKQLFWPIEYRVLRDASGVLFTCEEERAAARSSFRPYRVREVVVGLGISPPPDNVEDQRQAFFALHPELHNGSFLLFMSRIHPKKGCDLLLRAFAQVPELRSSREVVIAGPGDPGYVASLKSLAQQLGISDRLTWTGMLAGDAKWGALRAADALVLPSHQENFGVVIAESLACGTPVLISDKVNVWREAIQDGAGLKEADDLDGVVRLLVAWLNLSRETTSAMRSMATETYLRRFHIVSAAQKLVQLAIERSPADFPVTKEAE